MNITVGVSTYGPLDRVNKFMLSFWNSFEESAHVVSTVCVDDGTPNPGKVRERERDCKRLKFDFIAHEKNRGIPAAWNTIVKYAIEKNSDMVMIFNDDIYFIHPGWISRMAFFFENNQNLGTVGYPIVNEPGFNDNDSRWGTTPGLCGAAVGCSFAASPQVIYSIENPDKSKGYWEDLVSFHEETTMGFRMAQMGYLSWMLPWPPVRHDGGRTFHSSPELTWRDPSEYMPMEQYLDYARSSPFYIPQYEDMYAKGRVDRMMYSRAMFCKYWGILDLPRKMDIGDEKDVDIWNEPQKYVHQLVVPRTAGREIMWLNKEGKQEKAML